MTEKGAKQEFQFGWIAVMVISVVVVLLAVYAVVPNLNPVLSAVVAIAVGAGLTAWCDMQLHKQMISVGNSVGKDIRLTVEAIKTSNDGLAANIDKTATRVLEAIEATHRSMKEELVHK